MGAATSQQAEVPGVTSRPVDAVSERPSSSPSARRAIGIASEVRAISPTSAWVFLLVAGLFEAMWAIGLELSEGLSRPKPTVATAVAILVSMLLLAKTIEELPVGTADAVCTGIGAATTALLGVDLFDEPATPTRLGFVLVIVVSIAGLQVVSPT